ncbi:MAG TPA: cation-translocating P-type ATPase [Gaiellaceae bacterium]|nr:cation-translocating P-type ATPase [Gaiellaceae bacterium]
MATSAPTTTAPRLQEPWRQPADDVATALGTDADGGLDAREAAARLERVGPNRLDEEPPLPAWRKFLGQFADPLIYLLLAATVVSLVAWVLEGEEAAPYDAIVIAAIVVANAVLGYVQEARAEKAVAALQRMAAATATVVRDARPERVPAAEVVPGDVLLLAEGDAVAADARLLEAASLTVAEAALTGESEPVLKDVAALTGPAELADRVNMVFSGTAIARGRGRAVVTATGMATEMGNVARLLGSTVEQPTPLQREVDRLGRMLGVAVIVIAAVVVAAILLTADIGTASDVVSVLLVGVSLAVAAVPEGLPAVLSVVLALGVQRMARRNAIVKKLSSVETLGSASVICSDKTGTLTKNEMTIQKVVTASGEVDVSGGGYRPEGELLVDGSPLDDPLLIEEVRSVLVGGSLTNDAVLRQENGTWTIQGDPTEAAFLVAEAKIEGLPEARESRFERVGEIPFTSERKLMSTLQSDLEGDLGLAVVTKGAPDVLLGRCSGERSGREVRPLSDDRRRQILATVDRLADLALRTLAVAYRPVPQDPPPPEDETLERELVYLGLVGILDPPRSEAQAAIAEAHSAGVRVVMITGDHPHTAARVATELGIAPAGGRVVTGGELESLDDDGRAAVVRDAPIYARVAPEHKLAIVDGLHAEGRIVAMTGDGVNDAPALKAADIGVAMGVAGTDVAKEAADMILADDNFATIVSAIREGRGIFANIRKFLRFLLSSNIGEVLTMFFGVVLAGALGLEDTGEAIAVPLLATQILWINLLTDGAPALALGLDPPPDDVMSRPPRRLSDRVIDREMWLGIVWVGAVMAVVTLLALDLRLPGGIVGGSGSVAEARTMAFTTLVLAQLFNCFNARSDRTSAFHRLFTNPYLWAAIAFSALLQVAVVELPFLNDAFKTAPLGLDEWLICIGLASVVLWADEAKKLLERRLRG